jgi:outer membrane protein assembly factor BamB
MRVQATTTDAFARSGFLAAACLILTGCFGGGDDIIEPPAELVPFDADIDVRRVWNTKVGGGTERLRLGLQPASDGANIYVGSYDGRIEALNAETGRSQWSVRVEDNLTAGPAFGSGNLAFGTANGELLMFSAQDGELRWRREAGSEVIAPPAIGAGLVVFRTVDGRLRAFNLDTGEEAWSIEQSLPALTLRGDTSPVISGQLVVSGFDNGRIGAYDINDGTPLWEFPIATSTGRTELERLVDIGGDLAVVGNDVYTAGVNGRAVGIDLRTGQVIWQQEVSSFAGLGVDANNVYVTDEFGTVAAYDRRRGAPVWRQEDLRLRDVTAPTRFGNLLVVGDFEGYLHWLDPEDGRFRARERAGSDRITGAPLVLGQTLYVQSDDGSVAAFALRETG